MATRTAPQATAGSAPPADVGPEAPESLDQVRDILFGGQMRMVDARLRDMEERFEHEQTALRNELKRMLADVDASTKNELARQAERLETERAKRAEDVKALAQELSDAIKSLEKRHHRLEETTGLADAELRDQLLKSNATLSAELAHTATRISTALERATTTLRDEKLDRAAFGTALTEMAAKLTANGNASGTVSTES